MKIFNIYPIRNQDMYDNEDYAMILAHLLEKDKYDPNYFKHNFRVIMDNGVYENAKVSNRILSLIELANSSDILIDEIVIPDVIGDYVMSRKLYEENYQDMLANKDDYTFMYVAHASNIKELKDAVKMVNDEKELDLVLGIPKRCKFDRTSSEAIAVYKTCQVPIHFLGIKDSFAELEPVKNIIRSCDSVQMCYLTRDCKDSNDLLNECRHNPVIDLEKDCIDHNDLHIMKTKLNKELKDNGIL